MKKAKLLAAACLLALTSACFTPPQRKDPFAGLQNVKSGGGYKELSLALILSPNTKEAAAYLQKVQDSGNKWGMGLATVGYDTARIFGDITGMLQRQFKSVLQTDTVEDAAGKADLAAVLDVYAKVGTHSWATTSFETKLIVLKIDGTELDQLAGAGKAKVPYPATTLKVQDAVNDSLAALETALTNSPNMKSFASAAAKTVQLPAQATAPQAMGSPAAVGFSSDIESPRTQRPERPEDFAMVVGIEKYSNDLPDALFAERDAHSVKKHLLALGFPERNIKFLAGNRATKGNLEAYLEDWLARNVKENSRVFFYFSGHGAPEPETGQAYLIPWDGNPNFLNKTAYPVKRLYSTLNTLKAKKVIVALDSCFSGAGGRSLLAEGARPLVSKIESSLPASDKIVLFAAAAPTEITSTLKEQGHGIFTYYFLKGLDGAAKDSSGDITARGLYEYLKPKVQDAASRQNRDQTPVLEGAVQSEILRAR